MPVRITMLDGRTGIAEYRPTNPLGYRVRWDDGTDGTITPGQFQDADKAPLDAREE